jgi:hypothetical protein
MATHGRLIFALDATMSRQAAWDAAVELQAQMFAEASGLQVQLIYFRGSECRASNWAIDARALATKMRTISCVGGTTQWGKVLDHIRREHRQKPVSAAVLVGDCSEESADMLYGKTMGLPKLFMFQEGDDPAASVVFPELARRTGGAHFKLGPDSAHRLAGLLRGVAAFAAGGIPALRGRTDEASRLLLSRLNGPK